jgi:hypothetical protein
MAKSVVQLLPWQAEFLTCQDRVAGAIGGLGSGKSMIAANWLIDRCMQFPQGIHNVAGRDLPQLRRGAMPTIMGELDKRAIPYRHNLSDGSITIEETGCRIRPLSVDNFRSLRSLEADSLMCDEIVDWGDTNEEFVKYVYPRLRPSPTGKVHADLKPQLRFSTNPPLTLSHWLYDLLEVKKFCRYWQVSTRENTILLEADPEYLPGLLKSMSEEEALILVDGQWGNLTAGRTYKTFRRDQNCLPPLLGWGIPDIGLPLMWTLDFNVGLQCSVIAQMRLAPAIINLPAGPIAQMMSVIEKRKLAVPTIPGLQPRILSVVGQIRMEDAGTPDVVEEFIRRYGNHARMRGVRLYGDVAGGARAQQISSKSAARSNWQIICQELRRHNIPYEVRVGKQAPPVIDRINATNAQCRDAVKAIGMFVSKDLAPDVIIDLERVKYIEGKNEIDKSNPMETHLSDALGYLIYTERTLNHTRRQRFSTRH